MTSTATPRGIPAPEWETTRWFNSEVDLSLQSLRGRVVVLEVFQLLCPGCVSEGIPLAKRIAETFSVEDVAVIGLHSVFEHHNAMGPEVLEAFLHEYRVRFPVGVDAPSPDSDQPRSMTRYSLRGTPTLLIFDAEGALRVHHFGHAPELAVGAQIASLVAEAAWDRSLATPAPEAEANGAGGCTEKECAI
jgi:thiol-disulfide isomerase/thioredoxin